MIYHLLPELEPFSASRGGALAHTVANLARIDRNRVAVCLEADNTWNLPDEQILQLPGLQLYSRFRARQYYPQLINGPLLRKIYSALLQRLQKGDVVWCHNRPQTCAALASIVRRRGAKIVYHAHDAWSVLRVPHLIESLRPDAWIFVSEALRKQWLTRIPTLSNTFVVHNGANEDLFYPAPFHVNDVPIILFVGRLQPEKGVHILLDAIQMLNSQAIECKCRIVGSSFSGGSERTSYEDSLRLRATANVTFAGHRSAREIADEFRAADIFCCPSIWQEPFGKVNIEAMACGLPVVATRVGGIPEIAAQGGVILVEPEQVAELADALKRLLTEPSYRSRTAEEGLQSFSARFKWSTILEQYRLICSSTWIGTDHA
jgi:spore coat protein SA